MRARVCTRKQRCSRLFHNPLLSALYIRWLYLVRSQNKCVCRVENPAAERESEERTKSGKARQTQNTFSFNSFQSLFLSLCVRAVVAPAS